jgi:hypothetical protein
MRFGGTRQNKVHAIEARFAFLCWELVESRFDNLGEFLDHFRDFLLFFRHAFPQGTNRWGSTCRLLFYPNSRVSVRFVGDAQFRAAKGDSLTGG